MPRGTPRWSSDFAAKLAHRIDPFRLPVSAPWRLGCSKKVNHEIAPRRLSALRAPRERAHSVSGPLGPQEMPANSRRNSREAKTMRNQYVDWLVDAVVFELVSATHFPK